MMTIYKIITEFWIIHLLFFSFIVSTLLYYYLHKKTRIHLKYLYIDNVAVGFFAFLVSYNVFGQNLLYFAVNILLVVLFAFIITMVRFWRTPKRSVNAKDNEIVSPADGNVIYIKNIDSSDTPVSIKHKTISKLHEITKTNLLNAPCWLIGINMTPFDVHKNCAPIKGKILLNYHVNGKYLSLKNPAALSENERNTYVIQNESIQIGVVQIASKSVRRIVSYVDTHEIVNKGQWLGMIRFGSQVDVIIPKSSKLRISVGQQVYAIKTIIAEY